MDYESEAEYNDVMNAQAAAEAEAADAQAQAEHEEEMNNRPVRVFVCPCGGDKFILAGELGKTGRN